MFPVTRQVRRKRTPVFGRPGRTRGARMRARRAEEGGKTAHRGRARAEATQRPGRSRVGSASERLREGAAPEGEQRRARAKQGARERAREGLGRRAWGERREPGGGLGEIVRIRQAHARTRQAQRTVGPRTVRPPIRTLPAPGRRAPDPPGTNDAIRPGPAAVAEMRGPIRWDTVPSRSPHDPRTPPCA
jgi:hypothetical protein